jgi:hypothetical protein
MIRLILAFCLLLPAFAARADEASAPDQPPPLSEKSLFFTPNESAAIDETVAHALAKGGHRAEMITLDAVLYFGPTHWNVWLSGEKFTPTTARKDIRILAVAPDRVTLRLGQGEGERQVSLALHESAPKRAPH